jgi:hypothetical protein
MTTCKGFQCDCPTGEVCAKCQFCGRSKEDHDD